MNRSLRGKIIMEAHENALEVMDPEDEGFEELVAQEIDELTAQVEVSHRANLMVYSPEEEDDPLTEGTSPQEEEPPNTEDEEDNGA